MTTCQADRGIEHGLFERIQTRQFLPEFKLFPSLQFLLSGTDPSPLLMPQNSN
ncbi:hypothetical protein [Orrella sp. 11846]|uniref:hypothetical protein n=1 Tax=Orrella sp. 11846 TaxID=3409913 RepID=UPI003B5CECF1